MSLDVDGRVQELKTMLERELEGQLGTRVGCWPLSIGVLGLLLGLALLFESC